MTKCKEIVYRLSSQALLSIDRGVARSNYEDGSDILLLALGGLNGRQGRLPLQNEEVGLLAVGLIDDGAIAGLGDRLSGGASRFEPG